MTTNEKELDCDYCGNEIEEEECYSCGHKFTIGEVVYCYYDGEHHYCEDCIKKSKVG